MLALAPYLGLLLAILVSMAFVLVYWRGGWSRGHAAASAMREWVQSGMAGLGRVGSARPAGDSLLQVPLQYEDARMRNASATVVFDSGGEAREVVLRCDLDRPPRRQAVIGCARWGLSSRPLGPGESLARWDMRRLGLYALTSERGLVQDYRKVMHSLVESSRVGVAYLELDPNPPNLTLTLVLESGNLPSPAPLFNLLRRLVDTVPQHSSK